MTRNNQSSSWATWSAADHLNEAQRLVEICLDKDGMVSKTYVMAMLEKYEEGDPTFSLAALIPDLVIYDPTPMFLADLHVNMASAKMVRQGLRDS